ncbi:hypothetical protein [Spodoptera cosmioides nucleopolyhedrovirus]|uniref:Uncharacterized protein n=1 Tax=Spodoptera cosmioides nucleopolyhedrovirus TaxID=2605774 RepID=A0A6B7KI78_9ABAC|nr:hypothetical protein [Spodoptera cosmioides nucleopolyhedrovirus]
MFVLYNCINFSINVILMYLYIVVIIVCDNITCYVEINDCFRTIYDFHCYTHICKFITKQTP